jgi:biopolymer transport protein ExbD
MRKIKNTQTHLDMTPMVDVTFLLLIFFMVTASFAMQNVFPVPTAQETTDVGEEATDQELELVTVHIDEFNTFTVATADWLEEAPSKQDLYIHLQRAVEENKPDRLLVRASRECSHEKVVSAMDAGSHFGLRELQLQTID